MDKKIEIRSEEIQEILGKPPQWLVRWGVSIMFITVSILIIGSFFYKYPEKITTIIVIHTENMPATIVSKNTGKIDELFVYDNQFVESGTPLAVIESGANFNDVVFLKQYIDTIKNTINSEKNVLYPIHRNLLLGDIQQSYNSYSKAYSDINVFQETTSFVENKIANLHRQLSQYKSLYSKYNNQLSIYLEQLEIAKSQYQRDSLLFKSSIISKSDFEKSQSSYLQVKLLFENSRVAVDNSKISISQLEQTIIELRQMNFEQKQQLLSSLQSSVESLQNSINNWFLNFVLLSPISGKVVFSSIWQKNQNINSGDKVFYILPNEESRIIGKIKLPIQGSGKVKVGQKVNIKIDNYPYMEYGILKGTVSSISLMPSENFYLVEVALPNGLMTSYNKKIEFGQNLQGVAEIITEDVRLIERLIQPLKYLLSNN